MIVNESTAAQEWDAVVRIADVSADRRQLMVSAAAIWHARDLIAAVTRERHEARELAQSNLDAYREARDQRDALRAEVERLRGALSDENLLGAIARGWCSPENSAKEMDPVLAFAIAESIQKAALTPAEVKHDD